MYTLQHGFWIFFFAWRHSKVWHFVAGSMLPDYIYFVLLCLLIVNGRLEWRQLTEITPAVLMSILPLYPWVTQVDLVGHSAVYWGLAFFLSLIPAFSRAQAFIIGWGSHILVDGLTHSAYSNYILYPISMIATHSPVSYWEGEYYAREFKLVNGILIIIALSYLVRQWCKKKRKEEE